MPRESALQGAFICILFKVGRETQWAIKEIPELREMQEVIRILLLTLSKIPFVLPL